MLFYNIFVSIVLHAKYRHFITLFILRIMSEDTSDSINNSSSFSILTPTIFTHLIGRKYGISATLVNDSQCN